MGYVFQILITTFDQYENTLLIVESALNSNICINQ